MLCQGCVGKDGFYHVLPIPLLRIPGGIIAEREFLEAATLDCWLELGSATILEPLRTDSPRHIKATEAPGVLPPIAPVRDADSRHIGGWRWWEVDDIEPLEFDILLLVAASAWISHQHPEGDGLISPGEIQKLPAIFL